MICEPYTVVAVPFPFTDQAGTKRRPALALSATTFNKHGHTLMAMITTKSHRPWPGDYALLDWQSAGLDISCLVRLKLFTLDNRLILKSLGALAKKDRLHVERNVQAILPF